MAGVRRSRLTLTSRIRSVDQKSQHGSESSANGGNRAVTRNFEGAAQRTTRLRHRASERLFRRFRARSTTTVRVRTGHPGLHMHPEGATDYDAAPCCGYHRSPSTRCQALFEFRGQNGSNDQTFRSAHKGILVFHTESPLADSSFARLSPGRCQAPGTSSQALWRQRVVRPSDDGARPAGSVADQDRDGGNSLPLGGLELGVPVQFCSNPCPKWTAYVTKPHFR